MVRKNKTNQQSNNGVACLRCHNPIWGWFFIGLGSILAMEELEIISRNLLMLPFFLIAIGAYSLMKK